jgi:hypothetical protein
MLKEGFAPSEVIASAGTRSGKAWY